MKGKLLRAIVTLLFLGLPLLEIAGFVLVGREIGVLATVGLAVATTVLGVILLRIQGFGSMQRIRGAAEAGKVPGREMVHGAMIVVAGLLLLLPGFLTDAVGLLLFVPAVRDLAWRRLGGRITVIWPDGGRAAGARGPDRHPGDTVIDLDESDYSRRDDGESPWRRVERD